uniref:Arginine biosynthesis bifunctional protein ArgJ n=1 Tax=Candidatus Kentrum sp. DK TaxID=2126562 RepID=A0A450SS68_9GAMM|nr:MAG: glutamate N-acetyltransferase [Candidatus Kentron sp. DK]
MKTSSKCSFIPYKLRFLVSFRLVMKHDPCFFMRLYRQGFSHHNQHHNMTNTIQGIRLGVASAGIRAHLGLEHPHAETNDDRNDLTLIEIAEGTHTAAVFTRNAFRAAPVQVARRHLGAARPRFLLINTGNANAGTGKRGVADAMACCEIVAEQAGCPPEAVLPFSTGVIGEPLPVARIAANLAKAYQDLRADGWEQAARAIMTTDTVPKLVSRTIKTGAGPCAITGIAKGAGMIRPDMATMLAFVATDAPVTPGALREALAHAVDGSFHRITVDGDTSTNDACVLMATGTADIPLIDDLEKEAGRAFGQGVAEVCQELAKALIRDGEGATKFITVDVRGGRDRVECDQVAFAIAHSPLVKTALFASDPNWGRILAAVGRAGLADLDITGVRVFLDDVCIVTSGMRAEGYTEEQGRRVVQAPEITIRVELGRGRESAVVWTCDMSYEYVRINAEYRT